MLFRNYPPLVPAAENSHLLVQDPITMMFNPGILSSPLELSIYAYIFYEYRSLLVIWYIRENGPISEGSTPKIRLLLKNTTRLTDFEYQQPAILQLMHGLSLSITN